VTPTHTSPLTRKTITVAWLRERNACANAVKLFRKTFGKSARITAANVRKAVAADLNLDWIAERVLTTTIYAKWNAELAPINAKRDAEVAPINAKRDAELATINAKWDAEVATIYAKWRAEVATINAKWKADVAEAFIRLAGLKTP
jgi:hypothetical protein